MKKYEQLTFDRSHTTAYIKNILQNMLLNYQDRVYVAYRYDSFSQYEYYILYNVSLAGNRYMLFSGRNPDINNRRVIIISTDMLINKNARIFVDMNQ